MQLPSPPSPRCFLACSLEDAGRAAPAAVARVARKNLGLFCAYPSIEGRCCHWTKQRRPCWGFVATSHSEAVLMLPSASSAPVASD